MNERSRWVAPLFCVGFDGLEPSPFVRSFLEEGGGGAILFSRNIGSRDQVRSLNLELRGLSPSLPPLLLVDQEGGPVQRLRNVATVWPPAAAAGRARDPEVAFAFGRALGREVRALGFNVDCAPVLDVHTNPKNPIIGERALSSDPAEVGTLGLAEVRGFLDSGVLPCGKHFPGHGDTSADSHLTLPRLPHGADRLRAVELVPFRATLQALPLVMTAHVVYEGVDPALPATLSPVIVRDLLRGELGYEGVVVTDDLEMAAIEERWPVEEVVRLGLLAGVDLFLICHSERKQRRAIEAAARLVEEGVIPRERVETSLQRLRSLRERLVSWPPASDDEARRVLADPAHAELAREISFAGAVAPR